MEQQTYWKPATRTGQESRYFRENGRGQAKEACEETLIGRVRNRAGIFVSGGRAVVA